VLTPSTASERPSSLSQSAYRNLHAMAHLPVIVAQYELAGHARRTEHWAIAVLFSTKEAQIFEILGNKDTFEYVPSRRYRFNESSRFRGGCLVGRMEEDWVESAKAKLRDVPVIIGSNSWDCQDWTMEALRLLRDEGLIVRGSDCARIVEQDIREELGREKERWEEADDTIEAKLFLNNTH
jgi:hypothetical protein